MELCMVHCFTPEYNVSQTLLIESKYELLTFLTQKWNSIGYLLLQRFRVLPYRRRRPALYDVMESDVVEMIMPMADLYLVPR